jgi:hypothetical protein
MRSLLKWFWLAVGLAGSGVVLLAAYTAAISTEADFSKIQVGMTKEAGQR